MSERPDQLERVLRPIIEGQLRSFLNDHPTIVEAVDWYKPRQNKRETFIGSVAKRILRDLLCAETRVRLASASVEWATAEAENGELAFKLASPFEGQLAVSRCAGRGGLTPAPPAQAASGSDPA